MGQENVGEACRHVLALTVEERGIAGKEGIDQDLRRCRFDVKGGMAEPFDLHDILPDDLCFGPAIWNETNTCKDRIGKSNDNSDHRRTREPASAQPGHRRPRSRHQDDRHFHVGSRASDRDAARGDQAGQVRHRCGDASGGGRKGKGRGLRHRPAGQHGRQ
ncbi:hypothetical protein D9M72_573410 [compost metagenome]